MSALPRSPGLDGSSLRPQIPDELFELPLFGTLGKVLLLIGVSLVLMGLIAAWESPWLRLPLALVAGLTIFAFAATGHESGHLTASRIPWLNDFIGVISMSAVGMPLRGWKVYHDIHHRHTGKLGVDTDAQFTVAQYVHLTARGRRFIRWVNEHEFVFWPFGALFIFGICWSYSLEIATERGRYTRRIRMWNYADQAMAVAVIAGAMAYGWIFGPAAFFFAVMIPAAVGGILAAATFTTNHRNLPPLTPAETRRVRSYFHINTRTLTFPRWLPGPFFLAYVPYQIEHHLYPIVAGRNLARLSPYVRRHAAERGVELTYENYFKCTVAIARTRFAWGADGRLHRFAEIDRLLAQGVAPEDIPGYEKETIAVPRRDLRDVFGLR